MDASLLTVLPKEGLFFPPPLDRAIENMLQVKNESNKVVTFKIKTTAPQSYHVKPRMKILVAGEMCNVKVTYRPQGGPVETAAQHKFQIESRQLSEEELAKLPNVAADALWTAASSLPVSRVRINCSFCPLDQVPAGVKPIFPVSDDGRSEMSYTSDLHSAADTFVPAPPRSVGGPSTESLQQEIQHLRQALSATEGALKAAKAREDALKAENDALKEARPAPRRFGFCKMLFYLALLVGVGCAVKEYGPQALAALRKPPPPDTVTVVPVGSMYPDSVVVIDTETGPGLEKVDEL